MANYDSNYAIAQEISARIGASPVPFDSVYSIALAIYQELGGTEDNFDSVYSILLEILPLVEGGIASKVIDDSIVSLNKTWSSSKINTELGGKASLEYVDEKIDELAGTANSDIEGKETEDFKFVTELPESGETDELVVIKGDNTDTLYKYVEGSGWTVETPDATKLYFDVENEALYSYVTSEHQFARISMVNTIVVGSNLNTNADLKALKTPGVYSVVQRLTNATKGDYVKNWTLYVESVDYEEYDKSDSIYQRLVSNYTIQKRTWSATRATNDGWSNFSTYYAGEIKDTTTSKYYTWSSSKINSGLTLLDEKIDNVKPIEEVDALPEASENKEKFFRLSSDDNVYVSELKSRTSTTTNRLPDEQQIDKAYLYETSDDIYYYKGVAKLICSDGEIDGHVWQNTNYFVFTLDNAISASLESSCFSIDKENDTEWSVEGNIATTSDYDISYVQNAFDTLGGWGIQSVITATYNAPESAQIGNAYFSDGDYCYYNGVEYTLNYTDGVSIKAYGWVYEGNTSPSLYTPKKASEMYYQNIYSQGSIAGKYTDAVVYVIDYEAYPVVNNIITLDYPSSEEENVIGDYQIMYIPQLNAPDTEQVGHATIIDYDWDDTNLIYDGTEVNIEYEGNTYHGYKWNYPNRTDIYWFTTKKASELYGPSGWDLYLNNDGEIFWREGRTILNTVKYQRTEVIEEWDWLPLTDNATNDDIDLMFASEIKLIRYQDAEQQAEGFVDMWVNTSGETMEYDGQTYYKWVAWYNNPEGDIPEPIEYPDLVMLTNTLDITLPFNTESSEYEYTISYNSEESVWGDAGYFHGDYTQKTVQ